MPVAVAELFLEARWRAAGWAQVGRFLSGSLVVKDESKQKSTVNPGLVNPVALLIAAYHCSAVAK